MSATSTAPASTGTAPATAASLQRHHWHILTAALFGRFFDGYETFILFVSLTPALRDILPHNDLPRAAEFAGIIFAATMVGRSVGGMTSGVLADYIGRKQTMLWSYIIYTISTLLTGFVNDWGVLAVTRLVTGAALGGGLGLGATLIAETWPETMRSRGQGWMQSAFGVGGVLANLLWFALEPITGDAGWRWPYFLGALPGFFLLAFTYKNVPESERFLAKRQKRQALRRGKAVASEGDGADDDMMKQFTVAALFSRPELRSPLLKCMLMSFGTIASYWAVSTWLVPYVETVTEAAGHKNIHWGSLAGAFFALGAIPGYMTAPHIAESFNRRTMLAFYFIGSVISTLTVYQLVSAPWAFMAATFMHGFFTQGQFVWFAIYPPELFPTAVRGSAISTILNVTRFISVLGPIFAGVLITKLGGISTTATLFGFIYLIALAVVPFCPETRGKPLPN
jgi:MFS family permease